MLIEENIPLLEEILSNWKGEIGKDYKGYKNHVYRMIHCCFAIRSCNEDERKKIIIAGCFHDLGVWTENTVDYLPPSILLAREYLKGKNLDHWSTEIELMIDMHHKIRKYTDNKYSLVEVFRKGDLADFSLGLIKGGVPKEIMEKIKSTFPNEGFHKILLKMQGKWLIKHPLNPFPIMKW